MFEQVRLRGKKKKEIKKKRREKKKSCRVEWKSAEGDEKTAAARLKLRRGILMVTIMRKLKPVMS